MGTVLIKVAGLANGMIIKKDMWVESYDLDAKPDPRLMSFFTAEGNGVINGMFGGTITITPIRERAQRFRDVNTALRAWNTPSTTQPKRPDGKPNKPMTALNVEFEPVV